MNTMQSATQKDTPMGFAQAIKAGLFRPQPGADELQTGDRVLLQDGQVGVLTEVAALTVNVVILASRAQYTYPRAQVRTVLGPLGVAV